jgi:hypothetical protein
MTKPFVWASGVITCWKLRPNGQYECLIEPQCQGRSILGAQVERDYIAIRVVTIMGAGGVIYLASHTSVVQ